jgi:hypothetical protein
MNTIPFFLIPVAVTLILCLAIVGYFRPTLRRVLIDLCGTEERAHFWTAFSNILLIGLPLILSLNYRPEAGNVEALFFEMAGKLSGNLGGFLFALVGIGIMVSFFALMAPKSPRMETK